jgi:hypothetical protein
MPVVRITAVLLAVCLAAPACRAQPSSAAGDATAWRADLRYLVEQITTRHPDPYHHTPREVFDREVASLRDRLDGMRGDQAAVALVRIAALTGDGHTRLGPAAAPRYPFELEWLDGAWRVTRAAGEARSLLGGRVVAIGRVAADSAWTLARALVPAAESEGFSRFLAGRLLANAQVLRGLGIAWSAERVTLRVARDDGATREAELTADGLDADWDEAGGAPPLSRTADMRRAALRWAVVPGTGTAYVTWNHYLMRDARGVFGDSARAVFRSLDSAGVDRVVLDLRWNLGGDFTRGREYVLAELRRREWLLRPGALYVLIGRRTNSAAMVNAVDLKLAAGAILVGEPTGARPNSYSEAGFFRLPNSGLEGTVSICRYDLWPEDVPGVPPDRAAPPTWPDHRDGRDAALEWILAQPPPDPGAAPARGGARLTPPCRRDR